MLDIRLIREKPDFVKQRLATRGSGDEAKIDRLLQYDATRRKAETEFQQFLEQGEVAHEHRQDADGHEATGTTRHE